MKITNLQGLPEPFYRAVLNQEKEYSKGDADFSVTGLLSPPRISVLKKLHAKELTEDCVEKTWSLMGQIGHAILQKGSEGDIVEKRFFTEVDGVKISGQMDYGKDSCLWDFKFCSVWTAKEGSEKPEWCQQLNCYRYLAYRNGVDLKELKIVAIFRDWSKREASRNRDYPQEQVQIFPLEIWPHSQTEAFIKQRIKLHKDAQITLPQCTSEERWAKPETWAVFKSKNVRATKVHYSETEARTHLASLGDGYRVELRKGENVRCTSYCPVNQFCDFWKANQPKPSEEAF